jgi:ketosteroid isomerase-like protein
MAFSHLKTWWSKQPVEVKAAIIAAVASLLVALIGLLGICISNRAARSAASPPTPTPVPVCFVDEPTPRETFLALIDAEAHAVLIEDLEQIKQIYTPDATIRNDASGEEFADTVLYYSKKFDEETHCELEHHSFEVVDMDDTSAHVTSASRGLWGTGSSADCTQHYDNPQGSDVWTFRRGEDGCWRIQRLVFNAQN